MFDYNISGIQQIGIGVENLDVAWSWYAKHFGMDLPIFNDEAEASLMGQFTGNKIHARRAVLAMNLQGGGGFEIWQYTSRKPVTANCEVTEGDLGISHIHMRTEDAERAFNYFLSLENVELGEISKNLLGKKWFELRDPFGNKFKIIEDDYCFLKTKAVVGGVMGATIGVSDINSGSKVYQEGMNYGRTAVENLTSDFQRKWLLPTNRKVSAFSHLLGPTQLEIVCDTKKNRKPIFENRFWGDIGYIHICFDVQRMNQLRKKSADLGFPFLVDSENSFDMGEAAGQFAYIQDQDKTLIELVETHKVPILKKYGWYINLKNKKVQKPLPKIIFKVLGLNRVK